MKRTTDKRVGLIRSLFLADPYRKLVAVGFAVGLWYYLDSQVTATDQMDLGLDSVEDNREEEWLASFPNSDSLWVRVPPARWTVGGFQNASTGERILGVTLHFSGPKHEIERIREEELLFIATNSGGSDVEDLTAQGGFEFTVDDVRVLEFPVPIQRMTPERVKVILEYNKDQAIQLNREIVTFDLPSHVSPEDQENYRNRIVWTDPDFTVGEVVLYGPEDEIPALLRSSPLFHVSLSERDSDTVGGSLSLLPPFDHFTMAPELVNVSLPLELEPTPYKFSVPVWVDDLGLAEEERGRYGPEKPVVEVTVLASGAVDDQLRAFGTAAAQQDWASEFLRLYVRLEPGFDPELGFKNATLWIPDLDIDRRYYRLQGSVTVKIDQKEDKETANKR